MKAAKLFRWEAAHRLPAYDGPCRHLHGHSYRMRVEVEGTPCEDGMLIDFKELKALVGPLVDAWDHATIIGQEDRPLYEACQSLGSKLFVLPYPSTSENLCRYVVEYLRDEAGDVLAERGITRVTIRLHETETCYAEHSAELATHAAGEAVAETYPATVSPHDGYSESYGAPEHGYAPQPPAQGYPQQQAPPNPSQPGAPPSAPGLPPQVPAHPHQHPPQPPGYVQTPPPLEPSRVTVPDDPAWRS